MRKLTITFIIFSLLLIPLYFRNLYNDIIDKPKKNSYMYKYSNESIEFYNDNKLINTYYCNSDCSLHFIDTINYFNESKGTTIIKDGDKLIKYNFKDNKILKEAVYNKIIYNEIIPFDEFLLVIDNSTLKVINYLEETLLYINEISNFENLNVNYKNNVLTITNNKNEYNLNIEKIANIN